MSKHVAVLMGGWSAEREVSLRSGRPCADALERCGYRVSRVDMGRDIGECAAHAQARCRAQHAARPARRGRHRPGHAGNSRPALHAFRRAGLRRWRCRRTWPRRCSPRPACRCPAGSWSTRAEAARGHLLPRPYVIKPVAEGSSVGVFIVTEEHEHPPQELTRDGLGAGRAGAGRAFHRRQGADLRRDRRPGAGCHRNRRGDAFLRLRGEICARRLATRPSGTNLTICLPRGPKTGAGRASRPGLSGRDAAQTSATTTARPGTEGLVCLEVNTQPGMTETSLVPELAAYAGMNFDELVRWMVEDASLNR